MSKKIRRTIAKFDIGGRLLGQFGLPDPLSEALGTSPGKFAAEDAKKAAAAAAAGSAVGPGAAPTAVSDETMAAREAQRRRQAAYSGLSANILTRPGGLGSSNTQLNSLLGS